MGVASAIGMRASARSQSEAGSVQITKSIERENKTRCKGKYTAYFGRGNNRGKQSDQGKHLQSQCRSERLRVHYGKPICFVCCSASCCSIAKLLCGDADKDRAHFAARTDAVDVFGVYTFSRSINQAVQALYGTRN